MSRTPDYDVHAMNKTTDEKNRVGAAWLNENGTLSITLTAFIKLESSEDLVITLFPRQEKTK